MSNLFTDIFDSPRRRIWNGLADIKVDAVLGGGTAIALQLGHRISYDYDMLLGKPVAKNLNLKIRAAFPNSAIQTQVDSGDELTVSVDGVRVTYLYYPFPSLYSPVSTGAVSMIDLRDAAANKAYAIGRRGAWRDYFDLHALCTLGGLSLRSVIADSERKFGGLFSSRLLLQQLSYTGDISDFSIEPFHASVTDPDEILAYFREQVQAFFE